MHFEPWIPRVIGCRLDFLDSGDVAWWPTRLRGHFLLMAITFLHAADIHLDSPLKGLERYENAPVERIRGATRRAFTRLIDLAIEKRVDFVLIAGDLYDGDWRDYNTGLYLVRELGRLRDQKIPVFVIAGNHDAANKMTRDPHAAGQRPAPRPRSARDRSA